jgi:hypothetical protein
VVHDTPASGFSDDNPLQRFWRDVAVGTRHPFFAPYILAEDYGRLAFDVLPTASLALERLEPATRPAAAMDAAPADVT